MMQPPAEALCSDCPPVGYPTDKTRCAECPRHTPSAAALLEQLERWPKSHALSLIDSALRDERNAALERAAQTLDTPLGGSTYDAAARRIRGLLERQ